MKHRGLETRSRERDREPTDAELARLYTHWAARLRQRIDMPLLCRFALATGMRQDEICRLQVDDVDRKARTVVLRDRKDPRNKAGNDQTVPLLPDAWAIVAPLIRDREVGNIFGVRAASVSTAFTRTCKEGGIEDLHFHDRRHRATARSARGSARCSRPASTRAQRRPQVDAAVIPLGRQTRRCTSELPRIACGRSAAMVTSLVTGAAVPLWDRALVQAMNDATLGVWEQASIHRIVVVNADGQTYRQVLACGSREYEELLRCFTSRGFDARPVGGQTQMHPLRQALASA